MSGPVLNHGPLLLPDLLGHPLDGPMLLAPDFFRHLPDVSVLVLCPKGVDRLEGGALGLLQGAPVQRVLAPVLRNLVAINQWVHLETGANPLRISSCGTNRNHRQGDPGQHLIDFDWNVPTSARFCLGSCKSGRIGMACGQHGGIPKSKSTKHSLRPDGSPCT